MHTTTIAWLVPLLVAGARPLEAQDAPKPNILVVVCDDLNDTVEGWGGHPQALTPHLDRLASEGVRFTNAHANAVRCAPSRASLWTGLLPSTSGYYGHQPKKNHWLDNPVLGEAVTLFEHFTAEGYATLGTGKVFHNGQDEATLLSEPFGVFPDFGPFPWDGVKFSKSGSRKGVGHPSMPHPMHKAYWVGFGPLSDIPSVGGYTGWSLRDGDFAYESEAARDPMPDEQSVAWACEQLEREWDRPFLLVVGLNRPHAPRYAPLEYFERFPLDSIELPVHLDYDVLDTPPPLWQDIPTGEPTHASESLQRLIEAGGDELWRKWVQSYLASTAFVDDQLGALLDALDASPWAENTIVVFTSDHGVHMGEKGFLNKGTAWEESTRVPLVVRAPDAGPIAQTCEQPVSLVDIFPTLVDLADVSAHTASGSELALDGLSLRPLLNDPSAPDWDGPLGAITAVRGQAKPYVDTVAPVDAQHFTLRTIRWRYTLCSDGTEELYDHDVDPYEWHNLAADPVHQWTLVGLREELLARTGRRVPESPPTQLAFAESWEGLEPTSDLSSLGAWEARGGDGTNGRVKVSNTAESTILLLEPHAPGLSKGVGTVDTFPSTPTIRLDVRMRNRTGSVPFRGPAMQIGNADFSQHYTLAAQPDHNRVVLRRRSGSGPGEQLTTFRFKHKPKQWVRWSMTLEQSDEGFTTIWVAADGVPLGSHVDTVPPDLGEGFAVGLQSRGNASLETSRDQFGDVLLYW